MPAGKKFVYPAAMINFVRDTLGYHDPCRVLPDVFQLIVGGQPALDRLNTDLTATGSIAAQVPFLRADGTILCCKFMCRKIENYVYFWISPRFQCMAEDIRAKGGAV